jgi:hypothetical protein
VISLFCLFFLHSCTCPSPLRAQTVRFMGLESSPPRVKLLLQRWWDVMSPSVIYNCVWKPRHNQSKARVGLGLGSWGNWAGALLHHTCSTPQRWRTFLTVLGKMEDSYVSLSDPFSYYFPTPCNIFLEIMKSFGTMKMSLSANPSLYRS